MSQFNIALICPDHKAPVTQEEIRLSDQRLGQAFANIKADGLLHKQAKLHAEVGFRGVASPTFSTSLPFFNKLQIGESGFKVDPQAFACLSVKQDQAVMLHEVGHLNEPFITSLFVVAGGLAIGGFYAVPKNFFKITKRAKRLTRMALRTSPADSPPNISKRFDIGTKSTLAAFRRNWKMLAFPVSQWVICGLAFIYSTRINEAYADLYAARHMGTPDYMSSGLTALQNSKRKRVDSKLKGIAEYSASAKFDNYQQLGIHIIAGGPFGLFLDTHPTVPQRHALLEENRKSIEAHKPAQTSLDVATNYTAVLRP